VGDWLHLVVRWLHVTAAIAWIGASFYFIALDQSLRPPATASEGVGGEAWEIHGGGFYRVEKYRLAPRALPDRLQWFKWEAYTTFISGFFLLCLMYYIGAEVYLIDPRVADIGKATAIAIGIGTLAGGWIVYDLLCKSPLGKNDKALGGVL